ncbi:MAG: hypothetical protein FJ271_14285 [Planctomycetes bacterium]|nr:hypothetical protein [Planctomycetota bacterium]
MKAKIASLALGALLALGNSVRAAPPVGASPQTTGKVLVLDNGRTLDGDIERHGQQYRIRRGMGEVWIPVSPEMKLCCDWQEAYELMASRANLLDPDERLRLARWCHLHDMRAQALAEATAASKMRPDHAASRQLVSVLERAMTTSQQPSATPKMPAPVPVAAVTNDISSDCVALFITRVQPILMNTCVSCHSAGKGGEFQLYRSYHGGTQAATQKNLGAVLKQIDPDHPILSPLLIKAICAHGNTGQPPIKRLSEPYKSMQDWVNYVLRQNPHLKKEEPKPRAQTTPEPRTVSTFTLPAPAVAGVPNLEGRQVAHEVVKEEDKPAPEARTPLRFVATPETAGTRAMEKVEQTPVVQGDPKLSPIPTHPVPAKAPAASRPSAVRPDQESGFSSGHSQPAHEPTDEFDPVIFNRQMHPGR